MTTQQELDTLFEGDAFTLSDRFGALCCKVCVVLMYAPLLPFLWTVGFALCLATYWMNKVFFLRIARTPPKYDTKTTREAVHFLKLGISLHLLMAVWVFGSKHRHPTMVTVTVPSFDAVEVPRNALPFALLFALNVIWSAARLLTGCCSCCCKKKGSSFDDEAELDSFSNEFVRSEQMESYLVCTQPTLCSAFGPDLLPMEEPLNQHTLKEAEFTYKKVIRGKSVDNKRFMP